MNDSQKRIPNTWRLAVVSLVCLAAILAAAGAQAAPGPSGWWKFDESSGTTAADSSGNANDGTLYNMTDGAWISGKHGGAIELDGSDDYVRVAHDAAIDFGDEDLTVCFWLKQSSASAETQYLVKGTQDSAGDPGSGKRYQIYYKDGEVRFAIDDDSSKSQINVAMAHFVTGDWVHVAAVRDTTANEMRLYTDGELRGTTADLTGSISQTEDLYIGRLAGGGACLGAAIDDLRIYPAALTGPEIQSLYAQGVTMASMPSPADEAIGVAVTPTLEWTSGSLALSHDVYFGTDLTAVTSATRSDPEFVSSQTANTYSPGTLVEGTTYYWRIDEVNDGEPESPWTGTVWGFTTFSDAAAVATDPTPPNGSSSVSLDPLLEWTAGPVALSHDVYFGTDQTAVTNAGHSDAQFKGNQTADSYSPGLLSQNTTYYWRIDEVNASYPGSPWTGTVWSFTTTDATAGAASNPTPADAATNVDINAQLGWTAGDGATSHDVYFGTQNPPPYQGRVSTTEFNPATLARNKTYYWRVDEIDSGDGTAVGSVWHFTTEAAATVEERYKWPEWVSQSSLNRYPNPTSSLSSWNYEVALLLSGIYEVWVETGGPMADYVTDYMQPWADQSFDSGGNFTRSTYTNLDMISPGRVLMAVYTETGLSKYLTGASEVISWLAAHPRNDERGFWHKGVYPWQMWLDGLYMAQPFSSWYADTASLPLWSDEATSQLLLIARHTQDPATGLLYHGYFEYGDGHSPIPDWADPVTGCNPEFWGRAIGWYISAMVDVLDRLPQDHYNRAALIQVLQDLVEGLSNYQDHDTGMWYQVVNKGDLSDNWVESSCTAFYVYGIAKAVQKGYVEPKYLANAWRGYRGLLNNKVVEIGGDLTLYGTVSVGTLNQNTSGSGTYDYYVHVGTSTNDKKGVGALVYASLQMSRMNDWVDTTTYTLSVSAVNGSVVKSPDLESYVAGSAVTLTATPAPDYRFTCWTGDAPSGHESDNPLLLTMDGDKTLTAVFGVAPNQPLIEDLSRAGYTTDTLYVGRRLYNDRFYTFEDPIPSNLEGQIYIRTLNDDKNLTPPTPDSSLLSFSLRRPATVYVCMTVEIATPPSWLDSWTLVGDTLQTTDNTRSLYRKEFAAGTVSLGYNREDGMPTGMSMYNAIVVPSTTATKYWNLFD
ncbi:glycoside hydrolase family 88 protein [Candidatus Sumerlaeota bacterium]|nr:glycoside hydrolase family 88 protein [Candidatus Sumerlaeota bacterium]